MTIGEMKEVLKQECDSHIDSCGNCKLRHLLSGSLCVGMYPWTDFEPEEVERQYKLLKDEEVITDNPVSHPSHYTQGGIECIDAMESAFGKEAVENFCLCNAFKYIWRNKHKNGLEDIDKAIWYLNKFKELCKDE